MVVELNKPSIGPYRLLIKVRRLLNRLPLRESQKVYILTLLIGALSGLTVVLFKILLELFQTHIIYKVASIPHSWRLALVIGVPGAGALIATLGLMVVSPEGLGSGVSQVKIATHLGHGRISANVIWGKLVFVALNIGSGASLGPEGPAVQISAAIASFLGRLFSVSKRTLQSLVPVGAAAGLAAAFNTPISAVTFTLEDILGDTTERPLGSIVIAAVISAVIERSILGEHPLFNAPAYKLNNALELAFYALLGVSVGLVSAFFKDGVMALRGWCKKHRSLPRFVLPAIGGLVVGALGAAALALTGSPSVLGEGYHELAAGLQGGLALKVLLILGLFKLFATMVSSGSGSPGGLFAPSLYVGGMLGGAVGVVAHLLIRSPYSDSGAFALVGMGAAFAGIIRAPVTSIIIVFEMTNNYSLILPLMVANVLSYAIATRLSAVPIYDAFILQDGIRPPHEVPNALRNVLVSKVMTRDVATVRAGITVQEAFAYVQTLPNHHHGYPVVEDGRLVSLVTFNDLKRALAAGEGRKRLNSLEKKDLISVYPDQPLSSVLVDLGRTSFSQFPVVSRHDPGVLLGIITMHDLARAAAVERP